MSEFAGNAVTHPSFFLALALHAGFLLHFLVNGVDCPTATARVVWYRDLDYLDCCC